MSKHINLFVDAEKLIDVCVNACHWSWWGTFQKDSNGIPCSVDVIDASPEDGVANRCGYKIDWQLGFQKVLERTPETFVALQTGTVDADAADILLQYAVFGEVRYA